MILSKRKLYCLAFIAFICLLWLIMMNSSNSLIKTHHAKPILYQLGSSWTAYEKDIQLFERSTNHQMIDRNNKSIYVNSTFLALEKTNDEDKLHLNLIQSQIKSKIILLWTTFFNNKNYISPLNGTSCPITECIFTSDRKYYPIADAVIFHIRNVDLKDLPDESIRKPSQRWIMLLHESPEFTPKEVIKALDGKFNWTITHRFDSDISLTPISKRLSSNQVPLVEDVNDLKLLVTNKKKMVAWFVSHCETPSRRESYASELQKYVTVDIFGTCGQHQCHPKMSPKCYNEISNKYFFYLSFENSLCKDYVTEKLFNPLEYPIVPIVMTSANLSIVAPPDSVISIDDFSGPSNLATYLIYLAKNVPMYMTYFKWKEEYKVESLVHYSCRLCQRLHDIKYKNEVKIYSNLYDWWFTNANCSSWTL